MQPMYPTKNAATIVPNSAPAQRVERQAKLEHQHKPNGKRHNDRKCRDLRVRQIQRLLNSVKNKTPRIIVRAEGNDFFKTFAKKLPLIRSLFGSSASINDGIPIVIELINVS